jgi:hypothetical protein
VKGRGLLAVIAAAVALASWAAPASAAKADWTLGGLPCSLIDVPSAAPVGTGSCPGVRPGGLVESEKGFCTFNFLFTGADGRRYIGTAGHCILGDDAFGGDAGEKSWTPGSGPVAKDSTGNRIGEFAYAVLQDPKDFSLIRLDDGVAANPAMCHFGGPTGVNSDRTSATVVLEHSGNGVGVGDVLPARSAVAQGMPDPDHVYATGAVVPGDSGSGIISSDGRAVGVIVTTGLHTGSIGTSDVDAGSMGVTRLAPQVARAERVLGTALTLQQAPTL